MLQPYLRAGEEQGRSDRPLDERHEDMPELAGVRVEVDGGVARPWAGGGGPGTEGLDVGHLAVVTEGLDVLRVVAGLGAQDRCHALRQHLQGKTLISQSKMSVFAYPASVVGEIHRKGLRNMANR